jgi:hypothetical protein
MHDPSLLGLSTCQTHVYFNNNNKTTTTTTTILIIIIITTTITITIIILIIITTTMLDRSTLGLANHVKPKVLGSGYQA